MVVFKSYSESVKRAYVYKFKNDLWKQQAVLKITDPRDDFGRSVAIQRYVSSFYFQQVM